MNKFVLSALAFTAAGSLASAGSEAEDWLSLDREIDSLASSLSQGSGANVGGIIRVSYQDSSDIEGIPSSGGGSGNDLGGFSLDNVTLFLDGVMGDFGYLISLENDDRMPASVNQPSGGTSSVLGEVGGGINTPGNRGADGYLGDVNGAGNIELLDAIVSIPCGENFTTHAGQQRTPFLHSALVDPDRTLFLNRTFSGATWDARDLGVVVEGDFDRFNVWLAGQNGGDGVGDEYRLTARATFDLLGTGVGMQEGALGAPADPNLTVGAAWSDDDNTNVGGTSSDGTAMAVEALFTDGPLFLSGELACYDEDYTVTDEEISPWTAMGGFLINPNNEVGLTYTNVGDDEHTNVLGLGYNHYVQGHAVKYQVNYNMVDSDDDDIDMDIIQVGMTLGFNR